MNLSKRNFDPQTYWRGLVRGQTTTDVDEVGHPDMGREFNVAAYALRRRALLRALRRARLSLAGLSVFEAAFGVGYYLQLWERARCARVAGVDLSPSAQQSAQRRFPQFDLRAGDIARIDEWADWPTLRHSFGLVTAIDVIYHIIDDTAAARAVVNLSELVQNDGVILITDKYTPNHLRLHPTPHVVRRSLDWYTELLSPHGFVRETMTPVFWCMDPPIFYAGQRVSAVTAYAVWAGMRATIKFWPRNSWAQLQLGKRVGRAGAALDRAVTTRLDRSPNLAIAIFRKS